MNSDQPRLRIVRPYARLGLTAQLDRLEALRRGLAALPDEAFLSDHYRELTSQYWTALRELVFDRPLREFLIKYYPGPPYEQ